MPERTIKRRLQDAGDAALASDDGPIFSTIAKLVEALNRSMPEGTGRLPDADDSVLLERSADRVERSELFKLERHAPVVVVRARFCYHRVVLGHHEDELKKHTFGRVRMPCAGFHKPPLITIPAGIVGIVGKKMAPLNRRTLRSGRLFDPPRWNDLFSSCFALIEEQQTEAPVIT